MHLKAYKMQNIYSVIILQVSHFKTDKYLVAALLSEVCAGGEPTWRQLGLRSKLVDFVIWALLFDLKSQFKRLFA